jgi:hypothetical protein
MGAKDPKGAPATPVTPIDKPWRLVVDLIHGADFEIAYETEDAAADAAGVLAAQAFIEQVRRTAVACSTRSRT